MDSIVEIMSADAVLAAKNATRFLHFVGLAIGLGAATLLDLMLLRFVVARKITQESWQLIEFGARLVSVGLVILWATGVAFIVQYAFFDPIKLTNEKIWAKLVIVAILTLNGMFIHGAVMPKIKAQIGRGLFDGMSGATKSAFLVSGAISVVSWYVPIAIGAFSQLNFQVSAIAILSIYATFLAVMILAMHAMMTLIAAKPANRGERPLPGR